MQCSVYLETLMIRSTLLLYAIHVDATWPECGQISRLLMPRSFSFIYTSQPNLLRSLSSVKRLLLAGFVSVLFYDCIAFLKYFCLLHFITVFILRVNYLCWFLLSVLDFFIWSRGQWALESSLLSIQNPLFQHAK